jgi:hypothetical protein
MSSEIIQTVAYDNYDEFHMSTSYFHKFSFHYFWRLFNEETDLRTK